MRIVQISTYDVSGGAGRAAYRLHRGLREMGHDCRMLVRHKDANDDSVFCVTPEIDEAGLQDRIFHLEAIQKRYIDSHRTEISNSLFSFPYPGYGLSELPLVMGADIVNLHWMAGYQSLITLKRLFSLGKPVVWTLHDMWPFTGGCHYSAGCEEYRKECSPCPQLADDLFALPGAILNDKKEFFRHADLTVVTPSKWMAACAGRSALFRDSRIEVIPNSLGTDIFRPVPKSEAKKSMGLGPETVTLLFGSEDCNEKRKGFKKLIAALRYCLTDSRFLKLIRDDKLKLVSFGRPNDEVNLLGVPAEPLGRLDSDKEISAAYSSADIFILPSLEDNLPNTVLESMSCATPVLAFDVGGLPDMVKNGVTGQLVPLGDTDQMGREILSLIFDLERRVLLGKRCREEIEDRYPLSVQARQYTELYDELLRSPKSTPQKEPEPPALGMRPSQWEDPAEPLMVSPEPGIGPHVGAIYDQLLFKALKDFAPYLQGRLTESEADRKARLAQVKEMKRLLKKSESDRRARLDQVNELTGLLEDSEVDRKARFDQIVELTGMLKASEERLKNTEERLKNLEATFPVRLMKKLQPGKFET